MPRLAATLCKGAYAHLCGTILYAAAAMAGAILGAQLAPLPGTVADFLTHLVVGALILPVVSLPFAAAAYVLLRLCGYRDWSSFALLGLLVGTALAVLVPVMEIQPEWNGYQLFTGGELAAAMLLHYAHGALTGLLYALSYWWVLVGPGPSPRSLPRP